MMTMAAPNAARPAAPAKAASPPKEAQSWPATRCCFSDYFVIG